LVTLGAFITGYAQPKLDFEIKKPKQFEERPLGSEKNADKNFTIVRRFFQNTYTHYNYYFNANNLINEIIEGAKRSSPDDYTDLLNYYPWSLENTKQSRDIDSILKTCTAGILLHDLRNDWIDNMYLLMGKAYYLRQDFDSAAMAFQYLNYAFSPKEKGGGDKPIGSNANEGTNAFTILSKEKKSYITSRPPSRNDGFVWQIRNLTDKGNYLDASSLLAILRNDPNLPKRLEPNLNEVTGYLYYKINSWDSAASYLEKSMEMASDPSDRARRWYLTGQLYQLAGNNEKASEAYSKCIGTATDLVMEVYARLNSIRLRKNDNPNIIQENVNDLVAMARKDKYTEYREIIYYAAGLVEMEREGYEAAAGFMQKSIESNTNNSKQRSLSFYALGNARFQQKQYGKAGPPYDSLQTSHLKEVDVEKVNARKPGCIDIYNAERIISLQDSLIALADMPEAERSAYVKKISKDLRKQLGLKEEVVDVGGQSLSQSGVTDEAPTLFASSGTWYFYEPSIRANGFNNFKKRWGARPNEDNWRRSAALGMMAGKMPNLMDESGNPDAVALKPQLSEEAYDSSDVSFDNLYSRIPLSEERRKKADDLVIKALYSKASALHEKIEDYPEAIKVYEEILRRIDTGSIAQQSLFDLIHCYTKIGDIAKANEARKKLEKGFKGTLNTDEAAEIAEKSKIADATYEKIYDLFLEGNFEQALREKQKADSLLGKSYWKPQLLYIQSIYHIKEREDSLAIKELNNIVSQFAGHGLAQKATRMIDVLKRRKEIEDYLTKLDVTRLEEDAIVPVTTRPVAPVIVTVPQNEKPVIDSTASKEATLLAEKAKADQERMEKEAAEKLALEKEKADRLAAEKEKADREAAEKLAAEKAEADRIAAEKALAEKQAAEKALADKELADKLAAEKELAEKELAEKMAAEKAQAEKELAERQARELEALAKDSANRIEAEKALAEKQAKEKAALEKEMAEKQALEKEKAEKELAEKIAAEKAQAEKDLADKQAKEKAEAERKAIEKVEKERIAAEKAKADREAAEKAALAKAAMVDNVTVGKPTTPSPFNIRANEKQIVVIILEKIDPAYVNEVSYSLANSSMKNRGDDEVEVIKKKIKEGLWLVELHSPSFSNMQAAYEYIKYIKPITQNELITWMDASKYQFITISEANLKELEKTADVQLYKKVLGEAVPGKF
jgi:hypothetical protein